MSLREKDFDPSSGWACLDALNAVKWALVFCSYTESDDAAHEWISPFCLFIR